MQPTEVPDRFFRDTLPGRFLAAGILVMMIAAWIVGSWVANRIEQGVVQNSAAAATIYIESFLSPLSQDLAASGDLSEPARVALNEVFSGTALGKRIVSYKIWKDDGTIVEASDAALRGQSFPPSDDLKTALTGKVAASFQNLGDQEDAAEAALGIPLLEVYSPIRAVWTGEVVAVVEFYQRADDLALELAIAKRNSWLVVVGVFGASGLMLYGIVHAGGRLIQRQQKELAEQLDETRKMSAQNVELRKKVMEAAQRSTSQADHVMQRIGQELHDGVAQHLSLASLRFEEARPADKGTAQTVKQALDAAMTEIRTISRGLALPDIDQLSMSDCIQRAVDDQNKVFQAAHRLKNLDKAIPEQPYSKKLCAYRFVQESLANAQKHAQASQASVHATAQAGMLTITVRDNGVGFDTEVTQSVTETGGQGILGLKSRAETLSGSVEISSAPGTGTRVQLTLPLEEDTS